MAAYETAAEIGALLDRYLVGLDDDVLDDAWAAALFTGNARVEFPMSRHEGLAGLAAYHRDALAAFQRTQHLNSPAVVELAGDRAALRANLVSTHVHLPSDDPSDIARAPLFATGTFVNGEAVRTADGWRLSVLSFRVVWLTGTPPSPAAQNGSSAGNGEPAQNGSSAQNGNSAKVGGSA